MDADLTIVVAVQCVVALGGASCVRGRVRRDLWVKHRSAPWPRLVSKEPIGGLLYGALMPAADEPSFHSP